MQSVRARSGSRVTRSCFAIDQVARGPTTCSASRRRSTLSPKAIGSAPNAPNERPIQNRRNPRRRSPWPRMALPKSLATFRRQQPCQRVIPLHRIRRPHPLPLACQRGHNPPHPRLFRSHSRLSARSTRRRTPTRRRLNPNLPPRRASALSFGSADHAGDPPTGARREPCAPVRAGIFYRVPTEDAQQPVLSLSIEGTWHSQAVEPRCL